MSEELREQFEALYEADAMPGESDWFKMKDDEYHHLNTQNAWEGFQACAKIKDAKYAKLRELAEKVATAGYYTHPIATAIDELRNYLKEVK